MDQLFDVLKEQMAKRRDSIIDARLITRDTERKAYRAQVAAGTHSGEKLKLTSLGLSRDDAGSIIAPAADVAFRQEYLNRAVVKVRCCVSPSNYLRLSAADSVGSKREFKWMSEKELTKLGITSGCKKLLKLVSCV